MPNSTKIRPLELFALGVPVYRQRFRNDANSASRERFYRLTRACCALHERLCQPLDSMALSDADGGDGDGAQFRFDVAKGRNERVVVFALNDHDNCVRVLPLAPRGHQTTARTQVIEPITSILPPTRAYAILPVRGDRVVLHHDRMHLNGNDGIGCIGGFWNFAKNWLHHFHSVPARYFHLYMGEVCYRFNHHGEDLNPLLQRLIRRTSIQEIRPILAGRVGIPDQFGDAIGSINRPETVNGFDYSQHPAE